MDVIRFIDCNYPGVVYTGTEDHMRGLSVEGGCPSKLEGTSPIPDEDMDGGFWSEEMAPDFWAITEAQYAAYLAWVNRGKDRADEPCPLPNY